MPRPVGHLEVICGPMFAGKSSMLLERLNAAGARGGSAAAFKPAQDTRYAAAAIATHDGRSTPARPLDDPSRLVALAGDATLIAVDEIHFFGSALIDPVLELIALGRRVVLAGVERDHLGRPFEPFPRLLCEADIVTKLSARCASCGGEAIHSQRMIEGEARIVVGGAEAYEARCRACFRR
jgi:thymidine kinase